MADANWLNYTGAIAGLVGAVAGIAGVVLSLLAFRRTGQIKSLEMRLELRRTESTLQSDIQRLVPLLELAKASRTRLAAAQGAYHSGATKHWLDEWNEDLAQTQRLTAGASVLDVDVSSFSQSQLESRLITVHKLQRQSAELAEKYQSSIAADDVGRERLQAVQLANSQARRDGK